jgi:hypothetical protein
MFWASCSTQFSLPRFKSAEPFISASFCKSACFLLLDVCSLFKDCHSQFETNRRRLGYRKCCIQDFCVWCVPITDHMCSPSEESSPGLCCVRIVVTIWPGINFKPYAQNREKTLQPQEKRKMPGLQFMTLWTYSESGQVRTSSENVLRVYGGTAAVYNENQDIYIHCDGHSNYRALRTHIYSFRSLLLQASMTTLIWTHYKTVLECQEDAMWHSGFP